MGRNFKMISLGKRRDILKEVAAERTRQIEVKGRTLATDDNNQPEDWRQHVRNQLVGHNDDLRAGLVKAAAVAVAGIEALDRKAGK